MTQTTSPPSAGDRGLAARVSLGRRFTPPTTEFVLIASTALVLTVFGWVMVLSATSARPDPWDGALKQGIFAMLGIPLMLLISRMPVAFLGRIAWPALIGATALQLLVFVPGLRVSSYGNTNWVNIAGFQLQPSEFLKLALALWIAFVLLRKRARLGIWHHVFIPVVPVSIMAIGTVIGGEDLGTAMVLVLIVLGALFFAGVKLRLFILPLIGGIVAVLGYALTSENRMKRILSAFSPESCDPTRECYQAVHGMWGMANGGIFGVGLGNSQEKYGWLPAAENDYIFAIVGEELGLIGCVLVLALFAVFAIGVFRIVRRSADPFARVAAGGIGVWILGQALINIGVVLRVFPVMGVPLPFMSQGGSALISVLAACGVLLAFARTLPAAESVARAQPTRGRVATTQGRVAKSDVLSERSATK
ncbi:putative peptidoglycan glycosyltransferase FtsW [Microbacterium sp. NPDC077391]|uniref:peptidoglycan glycosyltransferase FtsW n=1 Tax=unclassified Microbacterium TaxID=2609290 RepID=UPI0008FC984F|nr:MULTISPECIES: putative peptidoglycan glycosyltransferase FtsW [unclassified Microbacterium]OIU87885.1 cell division protein FtsW [Microbacterium sp. AR7-10]